MRSWFRSIRLFLPLVLLSLLTGAAHAEQFKVLVLSKTNGWHHDSIPAAVAGIRQLGRLHDFGVFWTEDAGRVMNDRELANYQAVVFLLTTGDILNAEQKAAFERYIRGGGGYVGVHSAADTEHGWPWYTRLVGRMFRTHPAIQTATLVANERSFPGMDRFPARFLFTEEWYEFGPTLSPGLKPLLSVDVRTYRPNTEPDGRQGEGRGTQQYPISWYQHYDGGRSFYTALGHLGATYSDERVLHHLYGGIYWAATGRGFSAE